MADLDARPQEVNLYTYGGDTTTVHIKITAEAIGERVFAAQLRSKQTAQKIDAEMQVVLTTSGADVVLLSEDSRRLSQRGEYEGWWDVQLYMLDGPDPVTTLAYGEWKIQPDVTRQP